MNHVAPAPTGIAPAHTNGQILLGLIGEGIGPSRTPRMQMAEGKAQGLNIRYDLFDLSALNLNVSDLPKLLTDIEAAGYAGVNVTHPCKQAVIPLLNELSADAQALGAVNTVLLRDGRRIGHNTDWSGFSENFHRRLNGADMAHAVQIGAGGAGSAVAYALLKLGAAKLTLIDTDLSRAESLVARYAPLFPAAKIEAADTPELSMQSATGLVNCTPMGMAAHPGLPLPATLLRPDLWVAEIVYFPLETALVQTARALGCRVSDGGGMAVFQAVEAFRLFTGQEPDAERMLTSFSV
ncbi:shikimate dehydrogenase [Acidocella aminolytica]|uniref:Shikimate dehydrogenase (NADP(+)) n=1 Tax=Acidocella aminolytica 101 = DSM 11237 TaxID=1120923 RepID=A0A0D6PFM8_9PROT|nr:shikimate dehydrogenase [Acidocella aminolytica]GAN80565.1 shikimate 5-dehydrogenase [Acidocella aminolytica 101 = DSM 11237]GBQ43064.1 shikimate 5-dehydrogenase [Acidocella aminolytica 101 = DSM 11237]SHE28828.1 shikimate dehydrogenase [Acidocella aminolytica 101 = DSM 11237]